MGGQNGLRRGRVGGRHCREAGVERAVVGARHARRLGILGLGLDDPDLSLFRYCSQKLG
jgi:hypothetical protein